MNPTEMLYIVRWYSESACCKKEDITLNPTEYQYNLVKGCDASNISILQLSKLLEFYDEQVGVQDE